MSKLLKRRATSKKQEIKKDDASKPTTEQIVDVMRTYKFYAHPPSFSVSVEKFSDLRTLSCLVEQGVFELSEGRVKPKGFALSCSDCKFFKQAEFSWNQPNGAVIKYQNAPICTRSGKSELLGWVQDWRRPAMCEKFTPKILESWGC